MALIGMPEAGKRFGVSGDSAKRALQKGGVELVRINGRAWAVEESDLKAFLEQRVGYKGRGRPLGKRLAETMIERN